jgi:hypothetical protein
MASLEPRPLQREWKERFPEWLARLEEAIDSGLTMKVIKGGFSHSGIYPINPLLITHSLPSIYPSYLAPKRIRTSLLDLGNKVITERSFLEVWSKERRKEEINENEKKEASIKALERLIRKEENETENNDNQSDVYEQLIIEKENQEFSNPEEENGMCKIVNIYCEILFLLYENNIFHYYYVIIFLLLMLFVCFLLLLSIIFT